MIKPHAWIKTMSATALLSSRAAFRKANSSSASLVAASSVPPIPLSMLATLTRVVQFLNENHLEEEGLYSKPGLGLERKELLRISKSHQLPDLSVYSPHSIASVVKQILGELYEPLIPADISQQLVGTVSDSRIDGEAEHLITEIFKQIRSTTREFLQVFLGHISNVATSGASRMSVTNLALHVGIALIRPTDDKTVLTSKIMIRRRKCIAEFLIRQASSLPYDCATEMNLPALPELLSTPLIHTTNSSLPASTQQLHFVQVTWDAGKSNFTHEQLEEMFGMFGKMESFGINNQGNRAIIAYIDAAGAEAAEHASIPSVRIRRRKPRQGEKQREYSSRSPERKRNPILRGDARGAFEDALTPKSNEISLTQALSEAEHKDEFQARPRSAFQANVAGEPLNTETTPTDDTIVVEDIEDDKPNEVIPHANTNDQFKEKEAHSSAPTSAVNQKLEEYFPTETLQTNQQLTYHQIMAQSSEPERASVFKRKNTVEEKSEEQQATQCQYDAKEILETEATAPAEITAELKTIVSCLTNENEHQHCMKDSNEKGSSPQTCTHDHNEHMITTGKLSSVPAQNLTTYKAESSVFVEAELLEPTSKPLPLAAAVASGGPISGRDDSILSKDSSNNDASIEELKSKLRDMEKILSTSTAALSTTKLSNEFERAVLQLHKQILDMVAECLVLSGASHGEASDKSISGTINAEFLDFLEAQANTQVKILKVEVRAGQELFRLHKTQHDKERGALEEEITALRVGRSETERLCAELHTDLRKCRTELACHVANATDIQRQKSVLEEKLDASEKKRHAKEVALTNLQAEYDKMHRVAAEAQVRVEKFKQCDIEEGKIGLNNQICHTRPDKAFTSICGNEDLPYTLKLFSKLAKQSIGKGVEKNLVSRAENLADTRITPSRPSNVVALETMKQQMTHDIQEQIAATRAALREMEICSSSGKTLEEEEEELRQLQLQLAVKSSEMDTAMNESRIKLKKILYSAAASSFCDDRADSDDMVSNQGPTIFDSTALVKELIAQAEKEPASKSTHLRTSAPNEELASYPGIQNQLDGSRSSQRLTQYHRPTDEVQSLLYTNWTTKRSRKMTQLATYRDQQTLLRAQQSMQTFQQTLAQTCD